MDIWLLVGIWINTIVLLSVGIATAMSLRSIADSVRRVEETAARGERMTGEILTRLTSSTAQ